MSIIFSAPLQPLLENDCIKVENKFIVGLGCWDNSPQSLNYGQLAATRKSYWKRPEKWIERCAKETMKNTNVQNTYVNFLFENQYELEYIYFPCLSFLVFLVV